MQINSFSFYKSASSSISRNWTNFWEKIILRNETTSTIRRRIETIVNLYFYSRTKTMKTAIHNGKKKKEKWNSFENRIIFIFTGVFHFQIALQIPSPYSNHRDFLFLASSAFTCEWLPYKSCCFSSNYYSIAMNAMTKKAFSHLFILFSGFFIVFISTSLRIHSNVRSHSLTRDSIEYNVN